MALLLSKFIWFVFVFLKKSANLGTPPFIMHCIVSVSYAILFVMSAFWSKTNVFFNCIRFFSLNSISFMAHYFSDEFPKIVIWMWIIFFLLMIYENFHSTQTRIIIFQRIFWNCCVQRKHLLSLVKWIWCISSNILSWFPKIRIR